VNLPHFCHSSEKQQLEQVEFDFIRALEQINHRTAGGARAAPTLVFLDYLSCSPRFGVFLESSKRDGMTLRFSKQSNSLSNYVTGSEGGEDDVFW